MTTTRSTTGTAAAERPAQTTAGIDLDPVIHAPARLKIMVTLAQLREADSLTFARLGTLLDLTPGNLITHLRRLDQAGYLTTVRTTRQTAATLTPAGRAALLEYRAALAALLG